MFIYYVSIRVYLFANILLAGNILLLVYYHLNRQFFKCIHITIKYQINFTKITNNNIKRIN